MRTKALLLISAALLLSDCPRTSSAHPADPRILRFGGYDWEVKSGEVYGPGPNRWDAGNVRVDRQGRLHLKISRPAPGAGPAKWRCAEITSVRKFGFGEYRFRVTGRVDQFDRNVVLGLFDYPTPDVGPDGTNEIDIEFARWGNAAWPYGNFTVYAASGKSGADNHLTYDTALTGTTGTNVFTRAADQVRFGAYTGDREDAAHKIAEWTYAPSDRRLIPQASLPVHLNLWLFRGHAPTDGKEVEIVVSAFTFTPAGEKPD